MALSIKTEEADRLARDLSRLTGETMTQAVTTALRERLERERAKPRAPGLAPDLDEFLAEFRTHLVDRRPYTKEEADELCGDNDLMRDMGLDPDAH